MALDPAAATAELITALKAANPSLGAAEEALIVASIQALATTILDHIKNNAEVIGSSATGGPVTGTIL